MSGGFRAFRLTIPGRSPLDELPDINGPVRKKGCAVACVYGPPSGVRICVSGWHRHHQVNKQLASTFPRTQFIACVSKHISTHAIHCLC